MPPAAQFLLVWAGARILQELQNFREAETAALLQCLVPGTGAQVEPIDVSLKGWSLAWLHGCSPKVAQSMQHRSALIAGVLQVGHHNTMIGRACCGRPHQCNTSTLCITNNAFMHACLLVRAETACLLLDRIAESLYDSPATSDMSATVTVCVGCKFPQYAADCTICLTMQVLVCKNNIHKAADVAIEQGCKLQHCQVRVVGSDMPGASNIDSGISQDTCKCIAVYVLNMYQCTHALLPAHCCWSHS